jgi:hypothetical protein
MSWIGRVSKEFGVPIHSQIDTMGPGRTTESVYDSLYGMIPQIDSLGVFWGHLIGRWVCYMVRFISEYMVRYGDVHE